ncbi:hypothetical protein P3W45_000633 [Vairimorpha bombi]
METEFSASYIISECRKDNRSVLRWLASLGLLKNERTCDNGHTMSLTKNREPLGMQKTMQDDKKYLPRFYLRILASETLKGVIFEKIDPGTRILSDSYASYRSLYNSSIYEHDEVNYSLNFVNPNDITVHTQNVESIWCHVRKPTLYQ